MRTLEVDPVSAEFKLQATGDAPPMTPGEEARTDAIWTDLRRKRGDTLFDAPLLLFHDCDPNGMSGLWSTYRRYVAAREAPDVLGTIVPIGVSGVLICRGAVVLAERSASVTSYPGFFETAPSGTVDKSFWNPEYGVIDHVGQLMRELEEEVGVDHSAIARTTTLGIVRELDDPSYDICVRIDLDIESDTLEHVLRSASRSEDAGFTRVDIGDLRGFADEHRDSLLPTSAAILRHLGYL